MPAQNDPNEKAKALAELLIATSGFVHTLSSAMGLSPTQWAALRYFNRVNVSSANLVSFAKHQGITKGTASRTLTRLERKGLLVRLLDETDKRRNIIALTADSRKLLEQDPALELACVLEDLGLEKKARVQQIHISFDTKQARNLPQHTERVIFKLTSSDRTSLYVRI